MTEFPRNIEFQYTWRKYQQRVLDGLDEYLKDRHLHIIAPPGSGKTILGLEVAIRINQPTLILAPTIAIRNQWIQRFCELFLRTEIMPDWISKDIRNPGFMTFVTYQGLHAACNGLSIDEKIEEEEEFHESMDDKPSNQNLKSIIEGLNRVQVNTIIVDEAHHLQNEWWQTLIKIKEDLHPVIVGLTATPPYDVSANEWQKYLELNGPVNVEISVPELVIEGDLCPHQDYIYFTLPTEKEHQSLSEFRGHIAQVFEEIKNDKTLIEAIASHRIWLNPDEHLEYIYSNLSYYSACLIYLNACEIEIPEGHREIIGDKELNIPAFDYSWAETLIDFYLYRDKAYFKAFETHQKNLENRLRRSGAIERRVINFSKNSHVTSVLSSSMSKLAAISKIVEFEYGQLGHELRLVVLTDYIRKEFYVSTTNNSLKLNKIGVLTIFEQLRRENINGVKIGVLTGSMVIIPKSAYSEFKKKTKQCQIKNISCSDVPFDENYLLVHQTEELKHDLVYIITQIFQQGHIEVLVGTKSLLGEGWDAPAINSLILASFVGSFVLSNQMRGRAIRTQRDNLNKTGNVWHLACIDPTSKTGGDDLELLKRRFRSFVGISFRRDSGIENGIGRLNIPENIHEANQAEAKNLETFKYAASRAMLAERWTEALGKGMVLVEEIKIPFSEEGGYQKVKKMYLNKTIANLMATLGFGLTAFMEGFFQGLLRNLRNIRSLNDFYVFLLLFLGLGILFFGRLTFKFLSLYVRYKDISKDIEQIAIVVLRSLIKVGLLRTDPAKLIVSSKIDDFGAVYCHLEGGTTFEKSTFVNSLKEIVSPIDNPRYVIIRQGMQMFFIKQKDYHAIPEVIGRNKQMAIFFSEQWMELVGNCELIFTRTVEGRKLLLKSRIKSLASQFDNKIDHVNKWR